VSKTGLPECVNSLRQCEVHFFEGLVGKLSVMRKKFPIVDDIGGKIIPGR
jgi:hypothetical protein